MKIRSASFVKSGTRPAHYPPPDLPEIAFAGRSNVGKSSLMNRAMHRKSLVRVSGTPGRTQLLSWFDVNDEIRLCDLPGYGFAKVPASVKKNWDRMVGDYLSRRESLLALVLLVDVRRGFEPDDMQLVEACHQLGLQPILTVTKCDKLKSNALFNRKNAIAREMGGDIERDFVWCSAQTGAGVDQLWRRVTQLLPGPEA